MNTDRLRREFPWMKLNGDVFLSRRLFGWLALGVALFTLYGSFVPFHFHTRDFGESLSAFRWVLENRTGIQSRSDFLANFALGVPLGFGLFAWRLLDRQPNRLNFVGTFLFVWPWCVAFAALVEYGQLYFPGRTCSGSDVLAQSLGSAFGMLAFIIAGQKSIDYIRILFNHDRYRSPAVGLLMLYVGVLALTQLLPLDLSASPADWVRKFKDGRATLSPFTEFGTRLDVPAWRKGQAWLELAAVYFPIGLLLAFVPFTIPVRPFGAPAWPSAVRSGMRVFGLGVLLAAVLEACQFAVQSRSPSTSDVLLGGGAVLLGWLIAGGLGTGVSGGGVDVEAALILGQAWLLWLAVAAWLPFEFDGSIGGERIEQLNWLPFAAAQEKNYLSGLEEAIAKLLLFLPFGAVVAAVGTVTVANRRSRIGVGVALAAGIGLVLEAGQLFLPDRVASPTDILYAALGGGFGAAATVHLRQRVTEATVPSLSETPPPMHPLQVDDPMRLRR